MTVNDLPMKKEAAEAGDPSRSRSGSESVNVFEEEPVPTFDDDDFPDGGLRGWLVVAGVSLPPLTQTYIY